MKVVSARELKNRTGEALRYIAQGGKVVVTRRGKPLAVIMPYQELQPDDEVLRPLPEAWSEITEALRRHPPRFRSWQEALRWSRRRE